MVDLEALFKVTYALYLVTSFEGVKYNGLLGNSFCQVNSEPPTFLVIINKESYTHHMIEESGLFGVSELAQDAPFEFFGPFGFKSGKNTDKFAKINYKIAEKGVPVILDHTVAYFVCEVFKSVDMGSHTVFIGNLLESVSLSDKEPLTYAYYRDVKKGKTSRFAPTYVKTHAKK